MKKKYNAKKASTLKQQKSTNLAERTEQILLTMPRIIAAQISKDLLVLKQQEIKVKVDLKKNIEQTKKLALQLIALKKKTTTAAKKQIKTTQQKVKKLVQLGTMLAQGISTITKQTAALTQKKNKYNALQAQLMKFEKEWSNKTKTVKKTKSKPTVKRVTAKKTESKKMGMNPRATTSMSHATQQRMANSPNQMSKGLDQELEITPVSEKIT